MSWRPNRSLAFIVLAATFIGSSARASAPNDGCATPQPITGNGPFSFDLTQATSGAPGTGVVSCTQPPPNGIYNDLWYCWTADCTGLAFLSVCSPTPVIVAFYQAGCACPTGEPFCCGIDSCSMQPIFSCEVVCGQQYMIQVGTHFGGIPSIGSFSIQCQGTPCVCDDCCGKRPNFLPPSYNGGVAVTTQQEGISSRVVDYVNIAAPQQATGTFINWNAPFYTPIGAQNWTKTNLGTVFGVTLDDQGNTYLAHSSCYQPVFVNMGDAVGTIAGGAAGAVYKIDTNTGVPSTWTVLPNAFINACTGTECYPGLGNICFSCVHQMFYITNHEDGRIYRVNTAGVPQSTWKHATGALMSALPDPNDTNGFSPMTPHPNTLRGQRVWAVQVNGGRLYYSVWREDSLVPDPTYSNEVWSVALFPSGEFVVGSEQLEITPPDLQFVNYASPVSDISFKPNTCCMLLAQRSMWGDTISGAHQSKLLEYCKVGTVWTPSGTTFDIGEIPGLEHSSAGGCDYDWHTGAGVNVNVWGTGDAIKLNNPPINTDPNIYGLGGMTFAGTNPYLNGVMIDSNQATSQVDKTQQGEIEVTCPASTSTPVCDVAPDLQGCVNACVQPGYVCVPVKIKVLNSGLLEVLDCDCRPQGDCHVEYDPFVGGMCAGQCPDPAQPCNLIVTPAPDGTIYECNCDPLPPVCQVNSTGTACENTCPVGGGDCVPTVITMDCDGNYRVTKCECLPPGQCHVELDPVAPGVICVGTCPVGTGDCVTRARGQLDGSIKFWCECVGITMGTCEVVSVCDPENPGSCDPGCSGACPPGYACIPMEIREFPIGSGNFTITDCDCVPISNMPCHPIVMNGLVKCKGNCPAGVSCKLTRTLETVFPVGVRYRCECNCARPPLGMTAWWPMNDATGQPVRDIAGVANNGTPLPGGSGPISVAGCVGSALSFDGIDDWVNVPDHNDVDFFASAFTIDAWIRTTASTGLQVILDKRDPNGYRGYTLFLGNGQLALQLSDGSFNFANFVHPTNIADGNCHHVAVTVTRGFGSTVTLYVDGGSPQVLPNNTITGSIANAVDLWIGKRKPISTEIFYTGQIDEVEFFKRALTAAEIAQLYAAGPSGKCRELCYTPDVVFCGNETSKPLCFNICNYTTTPQTYNWNLFGPIGGSGCMNLGPLVFTPASGTATVAPGQCITICVLVGRPGGLVIPPPFNTTCYQLNVTNINTGNTFGCPGKITAIKQWCWQKDDVIDTGGGGSGGTGITTARVGTTRTVSFDVSNLSDPDGAIPFSIRLTVPDFDEPDPAYVSLNGLPPGVPVIDTLFAPLGGSTVFSVDLTVLDHEPFNMLSLVIEGDSNDDGAVDLIHRSGVRTTIGCSNELVGDLDGDGDADPIDLMRFSAALLNAPVQLYDLVLSDVNCDGHADGDDVQPFVNSYLAGP